MIFFFVLRFLFKSKKYPKYDKETCEQLYDDFLSTATGG